MRGREGEAERGVMEKSSEGDRQKPGRKRSHGKAECVSFGIICIMKTSEKLCALSAAISQSNTKDQQPFYCNVTVV